MNQIIENTLLSFNFKKVHRAMTALNWGWASTSMRVPTVAELVLEATELLEEADEMEVDCSIGTGGFTATKIYDEEYGYGLRLEFILSQAEFYERE